VTRQILILGNNLTGLVVAYRLLHYGFHIVIVDPPSEVETPNRLGAITEPIELTSPAPTTPLILHGFYHATWVLLQELAFDWPVQAAQSVGLEFGNNARKPYALPKPSKFLWRHPLTRWTLFKGLSWSDRWNVINFLEKQWEENRIADYNPDIESPETWLISAKQSEHSRSHFWNPLCRFFLNCDLSEASLGSLIKVLSYYWFGKPTDALTFLAPFGILRKVETELRQLIINKGVQIHPVHAKLHLDIDADGIRAVVLGDQHLTAQRYISALDPQNLLSLLSDRELTRYAYFSSLPQIPKIYGLAVQFKVQGIFQSPRLILHADPFDWITSQPSAPSKNRETPEIVVTCITLRESLVQKHSKEWLIDQGRTCIQNLLNLTPTWSRESSTPQIIRRIGPFFPCNQGSRIHRPLPQTPIANFLLAGTWTDTNGPASLESTITSANTCAEAVASAFYGTPD